MKQGVGIIICVCLLSFQALAQKYSTALGLRFGDGTYGITAKQRIFKTVAVEGLMTASERELLGTFLLVKHFPILGRGFNAYIGGGGHLGGLKDFGPVLGVDAMVGLEVKMPFMPLTASVDFKPAYHILHEDWFDAGTAVSVRYIIGKDTKEQRVKKREKRKRQKERAKRKKERLKEREERKEEREDQTFWERIGLGKKEDDQK
jgi:hypothetical protein